MGDSKLRNIDIDVNGKDLSRFIAESNRLGATCSVEPKKSTFTERRKTADILAFSVERRSRKSTENIGEPA